MPENQDDFKNRVIESVRQAFRDGCGQTEISEQAESDMLDYWESRFKVHEAEVRDQWSEKKSLALSKVQKMGKTAAESLTAEAKEAGTKIETDDFHKAREKVNIGKRITYWC